MDAGSADAGSHGDAGRPDAGSGGGDGGSVSDCSSLPLCDDFEGVAAGGAPDPARWAITAPGCNDKTATLAVDDSEAHSGKHSVKVTGKRNYCEHIFISNAAALASIGPVVYGRFWLKLANALGSEHVTFAAMKDANDSGKDLRMGGQSEILMYNRESDDATLPALSPAGIAMSAKPSPQVWHCVELMIDESQGFIQTWFDGADVTGLHVDGVPTSDVDDQWLRSNKTWRPALQDFRLGWESYGGSDMTLWFDDVALGSERVGCQ